MTNATMSITQQQSDDLKELLEDTISYFCDENMLSGETVWTVAECLAVAKQAQIKGLVV